MKEFFFVIIIIFWHSAEHRASKFILYLLYFITYEKFQIVKDFFQNMYQQVVLENSLNVIIKKLNVLFYAI
jgi:hypothetical protein